MSRYFEYLCDKYRTEYVAKVVSDSHNRETMLAFFIACGADFDDAHKYVWYTLGKYPF